MIETQENCPLCGHDRWYEVGQINVDPIRKYWSDIGVDIDSDYPVMKDGLSQRHCCQCHLHFFSPMACGESTLYAALAQQPWYYNPHKWEFSEALKILSNESPQRLLEIGSGSGNFLSKAAGIFERVVGLEFNPKGLERCQQKGLEVYDAPIESLSETFDAIVSFQVMEHLVDPGKMVSLCVDRLELGGVLLIAVPNQDGVLGEISENFLNLPPHHVTLWGKASLEYIARNHGLRLEAIVEEPISFDLYASYSFHLLDRVKQKGGGIINRLYNRVLYLLHRAALPVGYQMCRSMLAGHTILAVFRKPTAD